ncbi:BamA/TamA family outer membrane protein [Patiriisocius marinus]|nr:BamA/TamA family outer membrane protein [Patiriisocius marinus]
MKINEKIIAEIKPKKKHIDYRALESESKRLENSFRTYGYLESKLIEIKKNNDSTFTANYHLGKKIEYLKIHFDPENFSNKQISSISENSYETYFIIPFNKTESVLRELNKLQSSNGNAFAKLKLSNLKRSNDTLAAKIESNLGSTRKIDSIIVKGYEKFPRSFIKHAAGIKIGKKFNKNLLIKQNNIINNLPFSNSLKSPEALFEKNQTTVFLYLEKKNSNNFDGIIGFASKENGKGLELNGYINLELNNNLNFGEQFFINYKADGEEQRNFKVKTTLPYILQSPVGLSVELNLFRRDSTFSTNGQQIKAIYQAKPTTKYYLGYKANKSSNLQNTEDITTEIDDYSSTFGVGGVEYKNFQNSSIFPLKSTFLLEMQLGKRITDEFTDDQTQIQSILFHIFNLNNRNSFFVQNSTSILFSKKFLTNELFRFGGINSIRGFTENSIDASLYSVLNTEYRYILSSKTYIHSIIDLGYFENDVINQKEKLYSFGIGLGLQTKAGLFKFNFANGNIENQDFKFSNSKIHFSLVTNF